MPNAVIPPTQARTYAGSTAAERDRAPRPEASFPPTSTSPNTGIFETTPDRNAEKTSGESA